MPALRRAVVASLALLATACGGSDGGGDGGDDDTPTSVTISAGDAQSARYATAVPVAPAVRVAGANGPIAGYPVSFTVASGGGSVTGASATTNASGIATVGSWTLGPALGANTLTATAGGRSVTFTATAIAGAPSTITIEAGNNQQGGAGRLLAVAPSVKVTDGTFPVANATVVFAVTQGGGTVSPSSARTDANGIASAASWRLGALGPNAVTATVTGVAPVTFSATAVAVSATSVVAVIGDNAIGVQGNFTPTLPVVEVRDQFGNPFEGATVTFAVTGGGGSVNRATATTPASGRVSPGAWRFGAGAQQLTATVAGVAPAVIGATAGPVPPAQFTIDLRFLDPQPTPQIRAAFTDARDRWQSVIRADIPDFAGGVPANVCGTDLDDPPLPPVTGVVDDVIIHAWIVGIDGANGVLANAGPCYVRDATATAGRLTIVGLMRFDVDDANALLAEGALGETVLHEMGHVLGFGIWNSGINLYPNVTTGIGGNNPLFTGPSALQAFIAAQSPGAPRPEAAVPLENCQQPGVPLSCGPGTQDGHWREPIFDFELMTGYAESGRAEVLSAITITALRDMGYGVDDSQAEAYTIPTGGFRLAGGGGLRMARWERVAPWPVTSVDPNGRVSEVFRPAR